MPDGNVMFFSNLATDPDCKFVKISDSEGTLRNNWEEVEQNNIINSGTYRKGGDCLGVSIIPTVCGV